MRARAPERIDEAVHGAVTGRYGRQLNIACRPTTNSLVEFTGSPLLPACNLELATTRICSHNLALAVIA